MLLFTECYAQHVYMDQSIKFHHAPVPYPTVHHFGTEMCTFLSQSGVLWDMEQVHRWMKLTYFIHCSRLGMFCYGLVPVWFVRIFQSYFTSIRMQGFYLFLLSGKTSFHRILKPRDSCLDEI